MVASEEQKVLMVGCLQNTPGRLSDTAEDSKQRIVAEGAF